MTTQGRLESHALKQNKNKNKNKNKNNKNKNNKNKNNNNNNSFAPRSLLFPAIWSFLLCFVFVVAITRLLACMFACLFCWLGESEFGWDTVALLWLCTSGGGGGSGASFLYTLTLLIPPTVCHGCAAA